MARLAGKVALISGGARGQGAAEARLFTQEGAKVVFGDILDAEGTQVEAEIRAQGGEATYMHLNVTREQDWQSAVQTAESKYGKLDILVNNAGIAIHGTIEETTEDDWDHLMSINMKGVFLGTKYAIPATRPAHGWNGVLRAQKYPFHIDAHEVVPVIFCGLLDRPMDGNAGIIDQDIELAILRLGGLYRALPVLLTCHIQ